MYRVTSERLNQQPAGFSMIKRQLPLTAVACMILMNEPTPPQIELRRRVQLTRVIGEGAMGQVFDGYAPDLEQYVAVKILRPEHADDAEIRARFEGEAALQVQIDHPGCPPIYGQGVSEEGLPCYAMKNVEGRTLADLIAERGHAVRSVPWRKRLLAILLDACETVAYAHEIGVVHRDLKPENILIDRHQSVYVIDWGLAKRISNNGAPESGNPTLPGKIMGTPGYMAPEQATGNASKAGPQADVFALGAILYEILTGKRPFDGASEREQVLAAVHRDPKPPHYDHWRLPRSLSAICMNALRKDAAHRYADARGMAVDLRAFLEGRDSLLEHCRAAARHHPLRAIACAIAALAVIALAGLTIEQFWTDQRLARRAIARVSAMDAELATIAADAETLRSQMEDAKVSSARKAQLRERLQGLDSQWIMIELEAQHLLTNVAELRFVKVESEITPLARTRLLRLAESLLERDQPALAGGMIKNVLSRQQSGKAAVKLTDADIEQLKRLAAEAERRMNQ